MNIKTVKVMIEGTSPCLMHNGQLVNPFNPFTKAMKTITSKGKKTEEDLNELMKVEFLGGLYLDENLHPAWPGENIKAMIRTGAQKSRGGMLVVEGLDCPGVWPLIYKGPKTAEELWENKDFVDYRKCGIKQSSVMRTRPIFRSWALRFELLYNPQVIGSGEIIHKWVTEAGVRRGLGDHPDMGRFVVQEFCEA